MGCWGIFTGDYQLMGNNSLHAIDVMRQDTVLDRNPDQA
jgi:hypothetical protein